MQATVHNGRVTLTGHVEWLHQKEQVLVVPPEPHELEPPDDVC